MGLNNREHRYMRWLENEQLLRDKTPLWSHNIRTPADVDPRNYFLQQEMIQKNWEHQLKFTDFILGTIKVRMK